MFRIFGVAMIALAFATVAVRAQTAEKTHKLELTDAELTAIATALQKRPYEESAPVLNHLVAQINAEAAAQKVADDAAVKAKSVPTEPAPPPEKPKH